MTSAPSPDVNATPRARLAGRKDAYGVRLLTKRKIAERPVLALQPGVDDRGLAREPEPEHCSAVEAVLVDEQAAARYLVRAAEPRPRAGGSKRPRQVRLKCRQRPLIARRC